jgi:hypothetical protein
MIQGGSRSANDGNQVLVPNGLTAQSLIPPGGRQEVTSFGSHLEFEGCCGALLDMGRPVERVVNLSAKGTPYPFAC